MVGLFTGAMIAIIALHAFLRFDVLVGRSRVLGCQVLSAGLHPPQLSLQRTGTKPFECMREGRRGRAWATCWLEGDCQVLAGYHECKLYHMCCQRLYHLCCCCACYHRSSATACWSSCMCAFQWPGSAADTIQRCLGSAVFRCSVQHGVTSVAARNSPALRT